MKCYILFCINLLHISTILAQEQLTLEGSVTLGQSADSTAAQLGAIRWTGYVFQGWTGSSWKTLNSGSVADYDGIRYNTIKLGQQEWMTENLRTRHYNNGDEIINATTDFTWMFPTAAWCWYDNLSTNNDPWGKLYNWYAVTDNRGLCPVGWHVPDESEWTILTDFLGGLSAAGGKMKEVLLAYWVSQNLGATNASGFTGLPGGLRSIDGTFAGMRIDGHWWSSSATNATHAWTILLDHEDKGARETNGPKGDGYSVRCVKD